MCAKTEHTHSQACCVVGIILYVLACSLVGYLMVEFPSNSGALLLDGSFHVKYNYGIYLLFFSFFYFAFQRKRFVAPVFLVACFVLGLAEYFVISFKGQPIQPSDVLALGTAAEVASEFSYVPSASCVAAGLLCAASCVAFWRLAPQAPVDVPKVGTCVVNVLCAALVLFGAHAIYTSTDITEEADADVDVWFSTASYSEHGFALSFAALTQQLSPQVPDGYSYEYAESLLAAYASDDAAASTEDSGSSLVKKAYAAKEEEAVEVSEERPNVIVIMNETFSDISVYPELEEYADLVKNVRSIQKDSLVSGDALVSVLGGGTCNSEFEFLTGSSMSSIGHTNYPYVLYNLTGAESTAKQLSALGYGTHAIHPASANNWNRNRIYTQLGFDSFDDISSFEDAKALRGYVKDSATYKKALSYIEDNDEPQFVFDVTIQNHGGYETGSIPEKLQVETDTSYDEDAEISEYLSTVKVADKAIAKLIKKLKKVDEPTVVVFFGDHQPGFVTSLYEQAYGQRPDVDNDYDEIQKRFRTPYFVWANYDTGKDAVKSDVSLNYLSANMFDAVGLPTNTYQRYLLATEEEMPAVNINAVEDASGKWHWFEEDADVLKTYHDYAIVQYATLFD